jgi:hypothetical protein
VLAWAPKFFSELYSKLNFTNFPKSSTARNGNLLSEDIVTANKEGINLDLG